MRFMRVWKVYPVDLLIVINDNVNLTVVKDWLHAWLDALSGILF